MNNFTQIAMLGALIGLVVALVSLAPSIGFLENLFDSSFFWIAFGIMIFAYSKNKGCCAGKRKGAC